MWYLWSQCRDIITSIGIKLIWHDRYDHAEVIDVIFQLVPLEFFKVANSYYLLLVQPRMCVIVQIHLIIISEEKVWFIYRENYGIYIILYYDMHQELDYNLKFW